MKTVKTGSESVTLELTKDELTLINYFYKTSQVKNNKKEKEFSEKLDALIKHMDYIKKVETAISEVFNEK